MLGNSALPVVRSSPFKFLNLARQETVCWSWRHGLHEEGKWQEVKRWASGRPLDLSP